MKKIIFFILTIILVVVGNGCKERESDEIKVGVILPLSGSMSMGGNRVLEGIEIAVQHYIDKEENNFNLKLIVEDSRGEPRVGVNAINKLILQDKVNFILGDLISGVTLAMAPIAELNNVLVLAPGSSSPQIRYAGKNIFRNWVSDDFDGRVAADFLYNDLSARNVFLFNIQNDYGVGLAETFIESFTKLGGNIAGHESYSKDQTDFRTIILKLKNAEYDFIYLAGQPRDMGYIITQMNEFDIKSKIFANASVEERDFKTIAQDLNYNIYYSVPRFDLKDTSQVTRRFVDDYLRKYGVQPDIASAHGYDAAKALIKCIDKTDGTIDAVKLCLIDTPIFAGVTGEFSFDESGDVVKGVDIKKLHYTGHLELIHYISPKQLEK